MIRKEQIMQIFKDYSVTHGGLTEVADAIAALPLDEITAIQSHCKINMRTHRDYWLREELPDLTRGEHKGKYFAYKDISDGIRNGFFEPKKDEK